MTAEPKKRGDGRDDATDGTEPSPAMTDADVANGEGPPVNDTEARYGEDESPA